jgi:predicted peptidase
MAMVTCDSPKEDTYEGEWPETFNFWLVHEMYNDTQRLTKMIIDAGEGFSFNSSDIKKEDFKVHFESIHWHVDYNDSELSQSHKYATETGVGYGYRKIDAAYVIDELEKNGANIDLMERRELSARQSTLKKVDGKGRYVVLEFYSERELQELGFVYDPVAHAEDPTKGILTNYQRWQRTPGAESGWNSHADRMMQHKHVYEVEQSPELSIYHGATASTKKKWTYQKANEYWNNNEIVKGEIQILLNKYIASSNNATGATINYRLYKPEGTGKKPLYIWLHGNDGSRIVDGSATGTPWNPAPTNYWGGDENIPEFLQNHGHLTTGPGPLANKAHQEKYGGYYVLAPQAISGHQPAQIMPIIQELLGQYDIDEQRIYVSGHSAGGMGTIALLTAYPNFFAATMTTPGSIGFGTTAPTEEQLLKLANTPLWLFTIRGDDTNMDNLTLGIYNGIRNNNGSKVRMTYYPVNGYNGGFPTGATPTITQYDWRGNYGFKEDVVVVPAGYGWCHSAYEPAMSDLVKTDDPWNVGYTNTDTNDYSGAADRVSYQKFQWGYKDPNDQAGLTTYQWVFSWKRNNPNTNAEIDATSTTTTTMTP